MTAAKNHTPLHGLSVVCLRPSRDTGALAQRVRAAGGQWLSAPTLAIEAIDDARTTHRLCAALALPVLIFTSPNAVRCAQQRVSLPELRGAAIAVGSGTARALRRAGVAQVEQPGAGMNSEALLALPRLQQPPPRLALIGGEGGRGLLQPALQSRGATVERIDVYRRQPRRLRPSTRAALLAAPAPTVLLISSADALHALLAEADIAAAARDWFALPASERLAEIARGNGLRSLSPAGSAAPSALFAALCAHAKAAAFR